MPSDLELIKVVPSKRQIDYQSTEFYAFFSFWNEYVYKQGVGRWYRRSADFLIRQSWMRINGFHR